MGLVERVDEFRVGKRVFGLAGKSAPGWSVGVLSRNTEAIPDAADCMNQRIGLLIVYLASDAPDVDIENVGRRIEMNIPYMLEKHGARHDPAFVADQIFEELEFAGEELDFTPVPADPPRDEIDFKMA